ncbi:hypothetical protein Moror_17421 [Moniliophthora roreri MCA 2997]|nr:hypothetical protein Moror_17421 [Moniliophthora roreri MCA 2997]KAI3600398.1 hypothetical protein WG66_001762 [Moniliophthora roreri]
MSGSIEEDWSDSDEEEYSDVETLVNLGLPDGPLEAKSDACDAAVSRIGGHPAFLPSKEPLITCSQCKNCSYPMELLVQMYCPFEDSPMDRALYIWGCARSECQGKAGSVRAWRGLRYNEEYAKKLEKKLARKREREEAKRKAEEAEKAKAAAKSSNPFSMKGSTAPNNNNPFGLGAQIFGSQPTTTKEDEPESEDSDDDESDNDSVSSEESLITAMASTSITESPWKAAPTYPSLYLSTASEHLPAQSKPKAKISEIDDDGKDTDIATWASEAYENSLEVDHVFDRFSKRVAFEGEQCVRYELDGIPLPFASDAILDKLFPAPPSPTLPVTKPEFKVIPPKPKRTYKPDGAIPACEDCKGPRVFECQLMPNLINVLREEAAEKTKNMTILTDEERRKHIQRVLKGGSGERGMTWGTCMVFSCKNDCCEGKEGWKEEVVLIQWDT